MISSISKKNSLFYLVVISFWLLSFLPAFAQADSLKGQVQAFENSLSAKFEKEYLNIAKRDLGAIDETEFEWREQFLLEAKEKAEDNLGSNRRFKYYINVYKYATVTDRQYALKFWLENFIEGEELRAGRDKRTLRYATPTLILINPTHIIICNYDCRYFSYEDFDLWKDRLLEHFETSETMVIEVQCDGPVEWTKRAPDPKTRGLF
jgi:hypothetical protein